MANRSSKLLLQIVSSWDGKGPKSAGDDLGKLGKLAKGALAGVGVAMAAFAVDSAKTFHDFQSGMNEVFTLLPGISKEAMGQMSDDVRSFATETGKLPDEVIPSLYQALSAGVPQDNVFEFLKTANQAAVGGVSTLETAVDGLTSVVNSYGSDVISVGEASDVMFTAVRLGKTNFEELSSSLFNVIPTASSLGVTFQDVASGLAAMTAQGVPTSVATTQLRQAMVEASKSGTDLDSALKNLHGESFSQLIAKGMTTAEIFHSLRSSMPEQEFRDLFGSVEASNAALLLTSSAADEIIGSFGTLEDAVGSTSTAFEQMDQGGTPAVQKLKASYEDLKIEVGSLTDGPGADLILFLRDMIDTTKGLITGNSGLTAQIKQISGLIDRESFAYKTLLTTLKLIDPAMGAQVQLSVAAEQTAKKQASAVSELASKYGQVRTGAEMTNAEMGAWQARAAQATISTEALAEANDTLAESQRVLTAITNEERDAMVAAGEAADMFAGLSYDGNEAMARITINAQTAALETARLAEEEEEAAKAAEELAEQRRKAAEVARELAAAEGDYFAAALNSKDALVTYNEEIGTSQTNQESLNQAIFDAADASGANAEQLAILGGALGLYSEEAMEAALQTALIQAKVNELAQAYVNGEISIAEMRTELTAFQEGLLTTDEMSSSLASTTDTLNGSMVGTATSLNTAANEAAGLNSEVDVLSAKLGEIPPSISVHFNVSSDPIPDFGGGSGYVGGSGGIQAASGGKIIGGIVGRDSVPVMTMPGEIIIPTSHTKDMGSVMSFASRYVPLDGMRRFAEGGMVNGASGGSSAPVGGDIIQIYTQDQSADVVEQMQRRQDERRLIG